MPPTSPDQFGDKSYKAWGADRLDINTHTLACSMPGTRRTTSHAAKQLPWYPTGESTMC